MGSQRTVRLEIEVVDGDTVSRGREDAERIGERRDAALAPSDGCARAAFDVTPARSRPHSHLARSGATGHGTEVGESNGE